MVDHKKLGGSIPLARRMVPFVRTLFRNSSRRTRGPPPPATLRIRGK